MNYFEELSSLFWKVEVNDDKLNSMSLDEAISTIIKLIITQSEKANKLFFIGNGGSASIANHMATDFLKNAGIPAIAFNDSSLITCLSNDFGYEYVFEKPIDLLAKSGDVLFAISSSGRSKNILNGVKAANKNGCRVITLSGFDSNNPLRSMGEINLYVPSISYGFVESVHSIMCHCIVDTLIKEKSG